MSIGLYDQALITKLKNWVVDPSVTVMSPDETKRLFQYRADIHKDGEIKLPLIALRRDKSIEIVALAKSPMTFDGALIEASMQRSKSLNAVPIRIPYQIDIYTRLQEEADEYLRNFVFNILNYPKLQVEIPYNDLCMKHESNITLISPITDASDIPERLVAGQFTRYSINVRVEDAYLFSVSVKNNVSITTSVEVQE